MCDFNQVTHRLHRLFLKSGNVDMDVNNKSVIFSLSV